MSHTQFKSVSRHGLITAVLFIFLFSVSSFAQAPAIPDGMFIKAEATDIEFQIKVTWKDFETEDMYQLLGTNDSTPGPIFEGSPGNITLRPEWELIATLDPNTIEFVHNTIFSWTYAICAFREQEVSCFGNTEHITPKFPPAPATIDSIQVSQRTVNSLRLQWTHSSDTVFSRASIKRSGSSSTIIDSVENDPDQSVRFTGLDSNVSFELTVCVRNAGQTAENETCRSIASSTLPLIPLSPSDVSVVQDDPDPTGRTVKFTFNNRRSNEAAGISVRIIKDDNIIASHTFYPDAHDTREYQHTFSDLLPFTGYEAWVIPYNQTGVGTSVGVGFTTPTQINLAIQPLSADSVMLRLVRADVGEYTIEGKTGPLWLRIGTIRQTKPGEPRAVLSGLSGSRQIRVKWKLAYLRSETIATAAPLAAGAPELVSVNSSFTIIPGNPPRGGTRFVVTFRTTDGGRDRYILQRKSSSGWSTVDETPRLALFEDDQLVTLRHDTTGLLTQYRVCKTLGMAGRKTMNICSESSAWATAGVPKLGTQFRIPRVMPAFRLQPRP